MAGQPDVWACTACRSINRKRAGTCYRCHAPREMTGAAPSTLPTLGSEYVPPAVHPYRSATVRAFVVSVALLGAYVATTAIVVWILPPWGSEAELRGFTRTFPEAPWVAAAWVATVLILATAWAAWISRVVDNLPALGLGYARVSPRMAFFESFLIGPNALFAPARLREVIRKLDHTGRGPALITASWLAVIGPSVLFALYFRFARWTITYGELLHEIRIVLPAIWGAATAGVFLVIVVIVRVERISKARDEATRLAELTP